ncbi:TPA: pseudouridine synthase, partial [Burkholderia vietnamiensis]|nr:pseudouridine synthase [Burkholderia vietnamiensis]
MRTKLTVKNPRPASPTRAPVRSGSLVARKAVRPAAPAPGDKPPRAQKPAAAGAGKRAAESRDAQRPGADRAPRDAGAARGDARPRRAGAEGGARAPYRDKDAGEGAKRSFGDRRATGDRPA